jgi:basic membrane protein A and related proteins
MLLIQAGASGTRPALSPTPGPSCVTTFRVGFVADVAGLRSSVDAAAWRGVGEAIRESSCVHADLALPIRPSDYGRLLQAFAGDDLVIAGSFLLTEPVVDVARANPATHFLLVDPIVVPAGPGNLAVLTFRGDQSAFLAGALAAIVTQTGVVAGVYGPDGAIDRENRSGFERGARYVSQSVRVLGAYQPAEAGVPYLNPTWGRSQARAFASQRADVIFGAGGTTGEGALRGAEQSGIGCIASDVEASDPGCLLATSVMFIDRGVRMATADAIAGRWQGGLRALGLAEDAVGLSPVARRLLPEQLEQIQTIADLLAAGNLSDGS